jgi:hypothetical protein
MGYDVFLFSEIAARYEHARNTQSVDELASDLGITVRQLYNYAARLPTDLLYPAAGQQDDLPEQSNPA